MAFNDTSSIQDWRQLVEIELTGKTVRYARDAVTFDDLYTPGSYWVNPPSPRTVDGRHADPWTGEVVEYDMSGAVVSAAA